jgi:hypothetical protein
VKRRIGGAIAAIALVLGMAAPAGTASADASAYRVSTVRNREARSAIAKTGAGIDEVGADYVLVRATPGERKDIEALGYAVDPVVGTTDFPPADSNYHNFAEMQADLNTVASAHPSTVHRFTIGSSYEGRPLEAVRISDDGADNPAEPGVLFVGLHHAREHMTVEVALDLVHMFAESTDPSITSLVANRQIYVVPNLNPDGGEYDIATGSYRSWRKNRQPNAGTTQVGTDINRNYSYRWGCCGGSSSNKGSETYRGASAFSTPEASAIRDFVNAHGNVRTAISYHTYGGLILYPYGYTYTDVPSDMTRLDHDTFVAMAQHMAGTSGYTAEQGSDLYITDGDFNDWMYGAKHMYPFTFELAGNTFYPDDSKIPAELAKNRDAAVYAAQMADCPTSAAGATCGGPPPPGDAITNGDFEAGLTGWTAKRATAVASPVHGGTGAARLGGINGTKDKLSQAVSVPTGGQLSLYALVSGSDTTTGDKLQVRVVDSSGKTHTVASLTSAASHDAWQLLQADLSPYAGQTVTLLLQVSTDASAPSSFVVDDCAL